MCTIDADGKVQPCPAQIARLDQLTKSVSDILGRPVASPLDQPGPGQVQLEAILEVCPMCRVKVLENTTTTKERVAGLREHIRIGHPGHLAVFDAVAGALLGNPGEES
jgi:hypothetical protein